MRDSRRRLEPEGYQHHLPATGEQKAQHRNQLHGARGLPCGLGVLRRTVQVVEGRGDLPAGDAVSGRGWGGVSEGERGGLLKGKWGFNVKGRFMEGEKRDLLEGKRFSEGENGI